MATTSTTTLSGTGTGTPLEAEHRALKGTLDIAQDGHLFPRQEISTAVRDADWRDVHVPIAGWAAVTLGIVALALGTPIAKLVHGHDVEFAAMLDGNATWLHPVHGLARAVGNAGLGIEATFFLIAALGFGCTFASFGMALRSFGMRGRLAFVTALIAIAAPTLLLSARLPVESSLATAVAAMLLALTARLHGADKQPARSLILALATLAGVWLCRSVALVVPVTVFAIVSFEQRVSTTNERSTGRSLARWILLILILGASFALAIGAPGPLGQWHGSASATPMGASIATSSIVGAGALLAAPVLGLRRAPEEASAPRWLVIWLATGFAFALFGAGLRMSATLVMLPALAVLIGDHLARRALPSQATRDAAILGGVQLAFIAGAIALVAGSRASSPWSRSLQRADSPEVTRPTSALVDSNTSAVDRYLLRHRHGLALVELTRGSNGGPLPANTLDARGQLSAFGGVPR